MRRLRKFLSLVMSAVLVLGVLSGCVLFSEVNWAVVGSTALLAGILSMLTSLASLPEVDSREIEYKGSRAITPEDKENDRA